MLSIRSAENPEQKSLSQHQKKHHHHHQKKKKEQLLLKNTEIKMSNYTNLSCIQ